MAYFFYLQKKDAFERDSEVGWAMAIRCSCAYSLLRR